jgi:hypothetical protein
MEIKRNGSRPSGKGPADWMEHVTDEQYTP